jgi:hypothetical protein
VVSFSGFKDTDKNFSTAVKNDLVNRVLLLGGEVRYGEVFDIKITHIVSISPSSIGGNIMIVMSASVQNHEDTSSGIDMQMVGIATVGIG